VLKELWFFAMTIWKMGAGKQGVPRQRIIRFLSDRVPSDKIDKIVQVAEGSGLLVRFAGTEDFKPAARDGGIGVE
jgi:hypothetical protein